jgi:hypothetical protein
MPAEWPLEAGTHGTDVPAVEFGRVRTALARTPGIDIAAIEAQVGALCFD